MARTLEWGIWDGNLQYESHTNPLFPPVIHPGRFKSLRDLLKTDLWFTASEWLQCIQHLCSSTVVTMAWHLSTISLGHRPPPQHRNINGIITLSQHGLSWTHFILIALTDCHKSVLWSTNKQHLQRQPLQQTNWESHSTASVTTVRAVTGLVGSKIPASVRNWLFSVLSH